MMDDLVRWLGQQLDDDERIAREAGGAAWEELPVSGWVHTAPLPSSEWQPPGYDHHVASAPLIEDRAHIVAHDPARVLREIDAKRQILDWHRRPTQQEFSSGRYRTVGCRCFDGWPCTTLRALASVYADRPGCKKMWLP